MIKKVDRIASNDSQTKGDAMAALATEIARRHRVMYAYFSPLSRKCIKMPFRWKSCFIYGFLELRRAAVGDDDENMSWRYVEQKNQIDSTTDTKKRVISPTERIGVMNNKEQHRLRQSVPESCKFASQIFAPKLL